MYRHYIRTGTYGGHVLATYKDAQIAKRNSKLQTWDKEEKYTPAIGWNMYGEEGLGVDHEEWQKEHDAYMYLHGN